MHSDLPKVLHKVAGRSLLERAVRTVAALRPARIVVVIGHGEELMRKELSRLQALPELAGISLEPVLQSEQRGTGHAVQTAMTTLPPAGPPVLILPGDVPLLTADALSGLLRYGSSRAEGDYCALLSFRPADAAGFGRVIRDASGAVARIVEHRDCNATELAVQEVNSSIYLVTDSFLRRALGELRGDNAQRELYLTDIVATAARDKVALEAICVDDPLVVAGANTPAELAALEEERRRQINESLMVHGVTMEDPRTTYIDDGVSVGRDCRLGAGTRLYGATELADGVVVDGPCRIVNSVIGAGAHIKFCCEIEGSTVGASAQVGPFAHLRPGTVLESEVRIGNFVETKNSRLGKGAKANHLSYVGDATVGPEANIGAGTITCNYDGVAKHRTVIGEGAFIGSNSSLVAPVTIGDRAVIGAGSVITKEVPPGSLALERNSQTVIGEWSAKRRARKSGE